MEIRTPIIAILVLTILIVIYLRRSMPQVVSSRVFFCFLVAAFIHIVCDIVECAVFEYLDSSFHVLRRTSQVLYIGTLLICGFLISLFVYFKANTGKLISKRLVFFISIPAIVGIITLFTGGIY